VAVLVTLAALWAIYAIGSIGFSYRMFVGVSALFWIYSILLGVGYLLCDRTGRVPTWINNMVNTTVLAKQIIWSTLLLVGTITTWSDIRSHITGFLPNIILIVGIFIFLLLMYGWIRGIWQDRWQNLRNHPEQQV
jgi:hypothetical protein